MKHLNKAATKVFGQLIATLDENTQHRRISNSPGFMAVVVERLYSSHLGPIFSVSHYWRQNGDAMRDPDMTFLVGSDGDVYPMTFRQDAPSLVTEAAWFTDGTLQFSPAAQADITTFANTWMRNIREQQDLGGR